MFCKYSLITFINTLQNACITFEILVLSIERDSIPSKFVEKRKTIKIEI